MSFDINDGCKKKFDFCFAPKTYSVTPKGFNEKLDLLTNIPHKLKSMKTAVVQRVFDMTSCNSQTCLTPDEYKECTIILTN